MTGQLFSYSLTSGITLACLYICYKLTLSRTTFFKFNRFGILLIYVLAGITPFISLHTGTPVVIEDDGLVAPQFAVAEVYMQPGMSPIKYILMVYIIGVVIMALRLAADTAYLLYLKFSAVRVPIDGVEIRVHGNEKLAPFSWSGDIFMPASMIALPEEDLKMIIEHEHSHLANRHWLDLVVSNVVIVLQWYNPAAWLLHGELIRVHEFEADRHVLDCTTTPSEYQLLLIKRTAGSRFHTIADSLNHNSLKNRMTMMMKNQTKSRARLRALAMLPAMAVALCLTNSSCVKSACDKAEAEDAVETTAAQTEQTTTVEAEATSPDAALVPQDDAVVTAPDFEGGVAQLYQMLSKAIRYPEEALENNIQGRVIVELIVGKDGEIAKATVRKGVEESLDREAIAAINRIKEAGGKFTPGYDAEGNPVVTTYVLPITFKLQ